MSTPRKTPRKSLPGTGVRTPNKENQPVVGSPQVKQKLQLPGSIDANSFTSQTAQEEWLQLQTNIHGIEANAAKVDTSEIDNLNEEELEEMLSSMEEKLFQKHLEKECGSSLLKRLEEGEFLLRELVEKQQDPNVSSAEREATLARSKFLEGFLEKKAQLSSDIMKFQKENEEKRAKLRQLKEQNFDLQAKNRVAFQNLKEIRQKSKPPLSDPSINAAYRELDEMLQKIAIVRCTFQSLIVGSGIDWAKDEEMLSLVLQLGEKLKL